jgi:nucleotide-binding universal stress UspA family protein
MFKTIVVGTDGSDTAAIAVGTAIELAKAGGATLHVVHAYHSANSIGAALSAIDVEAVDAELATNANALCASVVAAATGAGVLCETHAVTGDPADGLVHVAQEVQADLLVVGNRGMTGLKRLVLGSVPNKISHHAPCSVLIVDTTH